jgi:hypothetical protein
MIFGYILFYFGQLYCLIWIIMGTNCEKQKEIIYLLLFDRAVSENFLHIRNWTYRSTQRLQGRGEILYIKVSPPPTPTP